MSDDKPDEKPRDIALLGPPTEDGQGRKVLRAREDRLEVGEIRALAEGKPIHGEVVTLKPREGAPWVCDVETTFAGPRALAPAAAPAPSPAPRGPSAPSAGPRKGPAQVASTAYRSNWDAIFAAADDDVCGPTSAPPPPSSPASKTLN